MPQDYLPNTGLRLVWFEDDDMKIEKDVKEFRGPIWKIVDDVETYLLKNLKLIRGVFVGFKRSQVLEYPVDAIREIVINALIHRNYFISSDVRLFILPTKIIVKNPGAFPPGTTPEDPEHIARNPLLCQYMYEKDYIEKFGVGISRVKKICEAHPLVSVRFEVKQYYTSVIFEKTKKFPHFDDLDQKIYLFIKEGANTSSQLVTKLGLSKVSLLKRIKKLKLLGVVKEHGKGRAVYYTVSK
jgi:predicted HTH transcriptional regulator